MKKGKSKIVIGGIIFMLTSAMIAYAAPEPKIQYPDYKTYYFKSYSDNGEQLNVETYSPGTKGDNKDVKYSPKTPNRGDLTFLGWNTSTSATSGLNQITVGYKSKTENTGTATYYAVWTGKNLTLTYNSGGVNASNMPGQDVSKAVTGVKNGANAKEVVATGASKVPIDPTGKYIFNGWYTAKSGGQRVTNSSVFTQNTTIYAHWILTPTPKTYEARRTMIID